MDAISEFLCHVKPDFLVENLFNVEFFVDYADNHVGFVVVVVINQHLFKYPVLTDAVFDVNLLEVEYASPQLNGPMVFVKVVFVI